MNTAQDAAQPVPARGFALLFLTGKSIGQRLPLEPGGELVIGRGKAAQVVIDDEKASRQHSRVFFEDGALMVEDMGSANGTLVNGKRITKSALKDGDHLRVGNSIFKVAGELDVSSSAQDWWQQTQKSRPRSRVKAIAGSLESVSLVELLQLLANSQKTGVLTIQSHGSTGKIHLRDGQIHHASIDGRTATQPDKTIYRLLRWIEGGFEFGPQEGDESGMITEPTQSLLLEGVRQADELTEIVSAIPQLNSRLRMPKPLPERLATLTPPELEMLQLVYEHESVLAVLDNFEGSDADGYRLLVDLQKRRLVEPSL